MTASLLDNYMAGRFHIGELVLPQWAPTLRDLLHYKQQMPYLHTVMVRPTLGPNFITYFYFACYSHYGFLGFAELEIEVCMRPGNLGQLACALACACDAPPLSAALPALPGAIRVVCTVK